MATVLKIEIVNTGTELMLGRVLNTHQQWLCQQLADRGYWVSRQVAVADTAEIVRAALREGLARADLVIATGGLGPTSDDLTRQAVANLLGRQLREDPLIVAHICRWLADRNRPQPEGFRAQALVPEGAVLLPNAHGTAPGLLLEVNPNPCALAGQPAWLLLLPGPPRELRPMFQEQALPWLLKTFPPVARFACRTLRTTGIGESMAQNAISRSLASLVAAGLEVGYCARPGEVDLRLAARGPQAVSLIGQAEASVRQALGRHIFGDESDTLESVIVWLLTQRRQTLVVAESCTGGRLASRVTDVPGASAVFLGGLVTYSNEFKQRLLGVRPETLAAHGAVSEPVVCEMAAGARASYGSDFALAITGIAGPDGGSDAKPVGTVFIALSSATGTQVVRQLNRYDRETFKHVTTQQALELLRQELTTTAAGSALTLSRS